MSPLIPVSGLPGVRVELGLPATGEELERRAVWRDSARVGEIVYIRSRQFSSSVYGWRPDLPYARGLQTQHDAIRTLLERS